MSAIGPGDFVEAVRTTEPRHTIIAGKIYRVDEVMEAIEDAIFCVACGNGRVGPRSAVTIVGINSVNRVYGWCPCLFRPIYRPKVTFEQLLKQPEPA